MLLVVFAVHAYVINVDMSGFRLLEAYMSTLSKYVCSWVDASNPEEFYFIVQGPLWILQ